MQMQVQTESRFVFITRQQYEYLVKHSACWMKIRWHEYKKEWQIGGVVCEAEPYKIENLICQLPE